MKLTGDDILLVDVGKGRQHVFEYMVYKNMDARISEWVRKTFRKGFGWDYYYTHDRIYFREAKYETLFKLKWP